jgi:hypothetical protein
MTEKVKRSEDNPIKLRTYLDGCAFIAFMFIVFWGVLILGTMAAFNIIYHAELLVCSGGIILAAIMFKLRSYES